MKNPETIIYGGAFNPPTLAHQTIVQACLDQYPDAEIWVMPSGNRHDKTFAIDNAHRLSMLHRMLAMVEGRTRTQVCEEEIHRPEMTEAYLTVQRLKAQHPERNFRYVFGADSYLSMPTWGQGTVLQAELPMLLIPRTGYELPEAPNVELLDIAIPGSSTEVRTAVAQGDPIDHLVCSGIARYIAEERLYLPNALVA